MFYCRNLFTSNLFVALAHLVYAQSGPSFADASSSNLLPPYQPSRIEVLERYQRAALLDSTTKNTVFKMSVQANWEKDGKTFWYKNVLNDSVIEYVLVDAVKNKKQLAFDHTKLAAALSKASGNEVFGKRMKISDQVFQGTDKAIIQINDQFWKCDLINYSCTRLLEPPSDSSFVVRLTGFKPYSRWDQHYIKGDSISPNKQWIAFIRDYNVYVRPANGGEEIQFTTDGTEQQPYGELVWSPGSE